MEILSDPEFWVGVGFALVIALFIYLRVPAMVGSMLDARAAAIAKELDGARKLREDAAALLEQYRRKAGEVGKEADAILAEVYKKAGASDRYKCSFYPGPHKFDSAMQAEAFAWFDKWLK